MPIKALRKREISATGEEIPLYEPCRESEGSQGYLMTASNQIFLVVGRGQPRGCLHHQARDASLLAAPS